MHNFYAKIIAGPLGYYAFVSYHHPSHPTLIYKHQADVIGLCRATITEAQEDMDHIIEMIDMQVRSGYVVLHQ